MTRGCTGIAAIVMILSIGGQQSQAVEGGLETSPLGNRDSMACSVRPVGTYIDNDFVNFSGTAPSICIRMCGAILKVPAVDDTLYMFNAVRVFDGTVAGARFGLTLNIPYVWSDMDIDGEISSGLAGGRRDQQYAFADITIAPIFGRTHGDLHQSLALHFFLPTGTYDTAKIVVQERSIDVPRTGKNRFGFAPTSSMTGFDPSNGLELSAELGVTLSTKNKATESQTAPAPHYEVTVIQHFFNKMAFGLTGYADPQVGDNSGQRAANMRIVTHAKSLQAEVDGIGSIWSWSTRIERAPVTIKTKSIVESDNA